MCSSDVSWKMWLMILRKEDIEHVQYPKLFAILLFVQMFILWEMFWSFSVQFLFL